MYTSSSSSEGAQEKRKDRMKLSLPPKLIAFLSFKPPLNANVLFVQVFFLECHLVCVMTKLRVLVLCFPYFTEYLY
jgi:hypothetical protein